MTDVPVSAVEVLPAPSPVCAGDTGVLSDVISRVEAAAAECQEHAAAASSALSSARGDIVRALDGKLGHLHTSGSIVEQTAASALLAVQSYARAVADIHVRAHLLEDEVIQSLVRVRTSVSTIEEIAQRKRTWTWTSQNWRTPPPLFMPAPADEPVPFLSGDADSFNWSQAAGAWASGVTVIEDACTRWRTLVSEREDVEQALVSALARTILVASAPGASVPPAVMVSSLTKLLSTQRPWEPVSVQRLLDGMLSPGEAAQLWKQLGDEGVDTDALIDQYSFELARLDGLPFGVRDRAARAALDYALSGKTELELAFARMGLSPDDMTLLDFRRDLVAVRDAIGAAETELGAGGIVQLATLGSHDGAVTAAISMGDLDSAERVGVFVSGMNSSVRSMAEVTDGFREIHDGVANVAMVTWVGYRAPNITEEMFQGRAERGSWALASFLEGVSTARVDHRPSKFVLLGHSYGSNVAAEALKLGGHEVDAFVTLGSAGLKYGTQSADLGVEEIHATHASGDGIAPVGKSVHFRPTSNGGPGYLPRVDPRDLEGAVEFSSEVSAHGKGVTMHNLTLPVDWGAAQWAADRLDGVASADEVGYLDSNSTTVKELQGILEGSR